MSSYTGLMLCLVLALAAAGIQIAITFESKAVGLDQRVSVIDGDTLEFNGRIVHLYGIDAPELGQLCLHDQTAQQCGLAAAFELKKLLDLVHTPLKCRPAKAADDPSQQTCTFNHTDIGRLLLESGYALATADVSPDYAEAQDSARQGDLGIWHDEYIRPNEWRAGKRLSAELGESSVPCPIKAVVGPNNRRLYFVPTDPDYETIEVDPASGGKLYCSDEDVRRDGWRREGQES